MTKLIMKTLSVALLALYSFNTMALDVTTSYANGDNLDAAKMTEIKDAVNSKQNRVSGSCPSGQSIRVVNTDGSVTCEVDTDTNTTYTAGSGIAISGTTISARIGADIRVNPSFTGIPQGSTAVTSVVSVTISAPSAGYVLVTHSGHAVIFGEPNTILLGIGDTATAFDTSVDIGSLDASSTRRYEYAYSTQYLYTVSAAGTYTYYGLAQKNTTFNAGLINVSPQSLSAIFIPNLY